MIFIHLNDEEKIQVLLLASGLFLVALVVSICLAVTICPLNRWLLERNSKKRLRHAFPSQLLISNVRHANGLIRATQQKGSHSLASYAGPPPAYEAALRATRLQSLTGSLPPINHRPDSGIGGGKRPMIDWLHPGSNTTDAAGTGIYNEGEKQLDFGDYFHQPREPAIESCPHAHIHIPIAALGEPIDRNRQPPIMLRLWVRMMDPGEFVARLRDPRGLGGGGQAAEGSGGQTTSSGHRLSLSRQLSIPQFIGSLVNIATGKPPGPPTMTATSQEASGEEVSEHRGGGDFSLCTTTQLAHPTGEFSSIMSNETTSSSSTATGTSGSMSPTVAIDISASCNANDRSDQRVVGDHQPFNSDAAIPTKQIAPTNNGTTNKQQQKSAPSEPQKTSSPSFTFSGGQGNFLTNNPITSRVLHMNVASFSYVKEESLISTKQHHQQNQLHFCDSLYRNNCNDRGDISHNSNEKNTNSKKNKTKEGKLCQLVISVCDIENLLNSSWLNERSCALLTNNSAIYIQCEILAPKSKSARLLRLPLKASSGLISSASGSSATLSSTSSSVVGTTVSSDKAHTVNFSSAISAAAVERPSTVIPFGMPVGWLEHLVGSNNSNNNNNTGMLCPLPDSCSTPSMDASLSKSDVSSSDQQPQSLITTAQDSSAVITGNINNNDSGKKCVKRTPQTTATTNWRHEPSADGKSIIVFSSVPKQVAHQQELAASTGGIQQSRLDCCCSACQALVAGAPELIQFDSVFVSPILSKSIIEDGYVRFRVYSQCKYVNETCLAELKLPLRQLLHSESRDNLGDTGSLPSAATPTTAPDNSTRQQQRPHGHQADFILDNLLVNLVTASTGSPMSSLIEQLSAEQQRIVAAANSNGAFGATGHQEQQESAFRLPWPLNSTINNDSNSVASSASASVNTVAANAPPDDQQHLDQSGYKPLKSSYSLNDSLYRLSSLREEHQELEEQQEAELERRIEQNYCRSLMVSHWLNYLVAPAYECQLVEEPRGKVILALSYLPTSNRVIFNAHKAIIDNDSYSASKQIMKNLRFQASTCYLLRFLMVLDGRVVKRKHTPVCKKPEWDSQEPITFDLVNLSKEQPSFVVALVMRNSASGTGSLQNLRPQCNCNNLSIHSANLSTILGLGRPAVAPSRAQKKHGGVQSEPESLHHHQASGAQGAGGGGGGGGVTGGAVAASGFMHDTSCALYRVDQASMSQQRTNNATTENERDLVIGHLVLSDNIWREMRAQPRKQIVKQFKIY